MNEFRTNPALVKVADVAMNALEEACEQWEHVRAAHAAALRMRLAAERFHHPESPFARRAYDMVKRIAARLEDAESNRYWQAGQLIAALNQLARHHGMDLYVTDTGDISLDDARLRYRELKAYDELCKPYYG